VRIGPKNARENDVGWRHPPVANWSIVNLIEENDRASGARSSQAMRQRIRRAPHLA